MAPAAGERLSRISFESLEGGVVAIVVLLHDLEAPSAIEDVPADEFSIDDIGQLAVAGIAQPRGANAGPGPVTRPGRTVYNTPSDRPDETNRACGPH